MMMWHREVPADRVGARTEVGDDGAHSNSGSNVTFEGRTARDLPVIFVCLNV
jgi:hypothetical protein